MVVPKWQQKVASRTASALQFLGGPKIGGGLKASIEAPPLKVDDWINLSDPGEDMDNLRGNHVFLEFWSSQCPPCVESVPKIIRLYDGYKDKVLFRTIHVDLYSPPATESDVHDFVASNSIRYPVGIDHTGFLWDRYAFTHLPHGVVIDENGRVEWSGSLFTNDIEAVFLRFFGSPTSNEDAKEYQQSKQTEKPKPAASNECKGGICMRRPS